MTPRQKELYDYVSTQIDETGVCPSYTEIMVYLGIKSKSGVAKIVNALKEQGVFISSPNRKRAIQVVPQDQWLDYRDDTTSFTLVFSDNSEVKITTNLMPSSILSKLRGCCGKELRWVK